MATKGIMFPEKCRLCLDNAGISDIFQCKSLIEDILLCTGVQITFNNRLPYQICSTCLDSVQIAKQLTITTQENDTLLRSLFDHESDADDGDVAEKVSDTDKVMPSCSKNTDQIIDTEIKNEIMNSSSDEESSILSIAVSKDLFQSIADITTITTNDPDKPSKDVTENSLLKRIKYEFECEVPNTDKVKPSCSKSTDQIIDREIKNEIMNSSSDEESSILSIAVSKDLFQSIADEAEFVILAGDILNDNYGHRVLALPLSTPIFVFGVGYHLPRDADTLYLRSLREMKLSKEFIPERYYLEVLFVMPFGCQHEEMCNMQRRTHSLTGPERDEVAARIYPNEVCSKYFDSQKQLYLHQRQHNKTLICPLDDCEKKFATNNGLSKHIRTHTGEKPFGCNVYRRSNLSTNLQRHSGKRPYLCIICNKAFTTKWNLKHHRWTHMSRSAKPFKCSLCKGAFIRQTEYIAHMNAHKSVRPYTCNYCGCQFIRKYNCQRHVREHEMAKKYVCKVPECGKSFHRSYYLSEHMKVHSGARPFSCSICGKTSSNKSNHNKHVKIHHAREPVATEA